MSFIGDFMSSPVPGLDAERDIKAFTGQTGAEAALRAADLQYQSAQEGIDYQRETRDQLLQLMAPYVQAGVVTLPQLQQLINQPQDTTALNAAASLAGLTLPTYETRQAPAQQLTQPATQTASKPQSNLSPAAASILGRSTYIPDQKRTISSVPQNTTGGRTDNVYMQVLQNTGDPAQAEAASRMAASGASVTGQSPAVQNAVNNYRQQTNQQTSPVQTAQTSQPQARNPVTYETVQTSPGSYTPIDRPLLDQFNQTLSTGRDTTALNRLTSLATDPNAQKEFITDSPFYGSLANDAERRLLANQAARGKVGSGGTALGLQDALVRLGSGLLNQEIGNLATADNAGLGSYQANLGNLGAGVSLNEGIRSADINQLLQFQGLQSGIRSDQLNNLFNLTTIGQNAAAGQGAGLQNSTNNIVDLLTGGASAQGAGAIGAANSYGQGAQNAAALAGTVASIFLSDERMKEDKKKVGKLKTNKGTYDFYTFKYKDGTPATGVMAQDVEKKNPKAVINTGVKLVDYARL